MAPGPLAAAAWDVVGEAHSWGIVLPAQDLESLLRARLERNLRGAEGLFVREHLADVQRTLDFARDAGIAVNQWQAQNLFQTGLAALLVDAPADVRTALEQVAERLHFSLEALGGSGIRP
jgi:hypothetical protein